MAKGKKKGGLTGISAFAMKEFLSSESSPATSREDVPREDLDEGSADIHASKKRRLNEAVGAPGKLPGGVTSGVSGTWTTTEREREREQRPVGWVQKYDARGLASHYTTADQVPEHLQKCTSVSALRVLNLTFFASARFFTTPSILFPIFLSAGMSA